MEKRSRCVNYSPEEKVLIANVCLKYKNILENKKTDQVTTQEKNKVWGLIAEEVNCMSNNVYRSADVLKRFYENRKREVRKIAAEEKRQLIATGGGQAKLIKKDACHDVILSIMNKKTVYGLYNELDADAQTNFEVSTPSQATSSSAGPRNIEVIDIQAVKDARDLHDIERENDANYSENDIEIQDLEYDGNDFSEVNKWKSYKPSDLKRPITSALLNDSQQPEPSRSKECSTPEQKKKVALPTSRRRPTVVKALTSSDLGDKYEKLVDKKLELAKKRLIKVEEEIAVIKSESALKKELLRLQIIAEKVKLKKLGISIPPEPK